MSEWTKEEHAAAKQQTERGQMLPIGAQKRALAEIERLNEERVADGYAIASMKREIDEMAERFAKGNREKDATIARLRGNETMARDAADRLYQAAGTLLEAACNLDFSIDDPEGAQLDPAIEGCAKALDAAEAEACAREAARRDGLDREVESLRAAIEEITGPQATDVERIDALAKAWKPTEEQIKAQAHARADDLGRLVALQDEAESLRADVARLRQAFDGVRLAWRDSVTALSDAWQRAEKHASENAPPSTTAQAHPRAPLPEVDAEDLWTDYRAGRGTVFASDRKAFLAGVAAGRRTRAPQSADDASLAERAQIVENTLRAAGVGLLVTHPSDGPRALQEVVRAVDASRPDEDPRMVPLSRYADGLETVSKQAGCGPETAAKLRVAVHAIRCAISGAPLDASRPGLSEAHKALRSTLESLHGLIPEHAFDALHAAARDVESASRGDIPAQVRAVPSEDADKASPASEPPTQPPRREQIEALLNDAEERATSRQVDDVVIGYLIKAIRLLAGGAQ